MPNVKSISTELYMGVLDLFANFLVPFFCGGILIDRKCFLPIIEFWLQDYFTLSLLRGFYNFSWKRFTVEEFLSDKLDEKKLRA